MVLLTVLVLGADTSTAQKPQRDLITREEKEGDVNALRNIDVSAIGEIRHLDGPEAEARFGQNHAAGAILITLFSGTRKDTLPPLKPPK